MIESYRPSGKFSPTFALLVAAGALATVLTAWLYQFLMNLIPLIYLNFLITIGFAFGLSMGMGALVNLGRCRNAIVAVAAALLIGGLGAGATHYFSYQFTLDEIVDMEGLDDAQAEMLAEQVGFAQFMQVRVDTGWTVGKVGRDSDGPPLSGLFVWLIWGIEGLALVGAAAYGAFGAARSPYCEACGEWSEDDDAFIFPAPSEETLDAVRSVQRVEDLFDVSIEPTGLLNHGLLFKPTKCPACDDTRHLSVCLRVVTVDSNGKEDIKDKDLLSHIVLTHEQAERFRAIGMGEDVSGEDENANATNDWSEEALAETLEAEAPDLSTEPADERPADEGPADEQSPEKKLVGKKLAQNQPAEAPPEPALDDDDTW